MSIAPIIKTVSCGYNFAVLLDDEGIVHIFGTLDSSTLTPLIPLTNIVSVDCGETMVLCLDREGTVFTFGKNDYCQLGILVSEKKISNTPIQVPDLPPMIGIACGGYFSICLDENNCVWSFGLNHIGQCGRENVVGERVGGAVLDSSKPGKIEDLVDIIKIKAGGNKGYCINFDNVVFGFGKNDDYELGIISSVTKFFTPQIIPTIPENVKEIAIGWRHSLVLDENKKVYYNRGDNKDPKSVYCELNGLPPIRAIRCTNSASFCIDEDGNVWSFGSGANEILGYKCSSTGVYSTPKKIDALQNIVTMSDGGLHCIAKDDLGRVWSWGRNAFGELGKPAGTNQQPQLIDSKYWDWLKYDVASSYKKSARK